MMKVLPPERGFGVPQALRRLLLVVMLVATTRSHALGNERASIAGGEFAPQYGLAAGQTTFFVGSFEIDKFPVTNEQFKEFVAREKSFQKGKVTSLLADANYLKHWPSDGSMLKVLKRTPVVHVSWFAAQAYCKWRGGRLPTVLEWEYVAAADEKRINASRDPKYIERILSWYSKPTPKVVKEVGMETPNVHGIYDLHGLVWEWTYDFNSVFVAGDSRREGDELKNMFCGAAALTAADKENYAAYMRYALRNSLKANYTTANNGFRCAYPVK